MFYGDTNEVLSTISSSQALFLIQHDLSILQHIPSRFSSTFSMGTTRESSTNIQHYFLFPFFPFPLFSLSLSIQREKSRRKATNLHCMK
ncbi:hypothetical protein BJX61DRAFT_22888 [Aspergillus egyptiacus]|nr:hypothetical protein BJX61DRAFT_22888 [Aspergillus egyptiacus]